MVKLKAFTLFDALIAVTITAMVISGISLIYSNLIDSEHPITYFKAKEEISKIHKITTETKAYFNANYDKDQYEIIQKIEPYKGKTDLWFVQYIVFINNKKVYTENHLIINEEE